MKTFLIAVALILTAGTSAFLFGRAHQGEVVAPIVEQLTPEEPAPYVGANFSIPYPSGYAVDTAYAYDDLGTDNVIHGVKFTVPSSFSDGTNLSSDTFISIETIPGVETCSAELFLSETVIPNTVTEGEMRYSVASLSDAGAGNRYEETVYAIPGTEPCIAIRYFIHYAAIENFPEGEVKEFDKQALFEAFDEIRTTLVVTP